MGKYCGIVTDKSWYEQYGVDDELLEAMACYEGIDKCFSMESACDKFISNYRKWNRRIYSDEVHMADYITYWTGTQRLYWEKEKLKLDMDSQSDIM